MNTTQRARASQLPDIARLCLRSVHGGKRPPNAMAFQGPEGHGENIWVFAHRRTDQIIYSFNATLETKPAKLRKDYWAPMAKIAFPKGAGRIGSTVFQKLRELKHLHETAWDDSLLYKKPIEYTEDEKKAAAKRAAGNEPEPLFTRNKAERGKALNAQKANSIADIAAVLGGTGPGNKVVAAGPGPKKLVEVTVSWASILDAGYAKKWTHNVTHTELVEPIPETALPAEAEAAA
ncbi:hypothetical protein CCM_07509 [Cordyceps militaris CM01]|uniref:Large ribosomal subunit protein mL67 n=1 Tax=Cordyceps militaris (strain CM01) TaxID=983644 RepID=G3JQ06_CORMM|nr:uncharacterized protein CCM_07509 [Cordyceps militaris CM01]EGX89257.1 hypothetical protein CCM_07509 [Cordyceps militaris CM01]